jgi:hypothetical protein
VCDGSVLNAEWESGLNSLLFSPFLLVAVRVVRCVRAQSALLSLRLCRLAVPYRSVRRRGPPRTIIQTQHNADETSREKTIALLHACDSLYRALCMYTDFW